jgi:hypothetical protein
MSNNNVYIECNKCNNYYNCDDCLENNKYLIKLGKKLHDNNDDVSKNVINNIKNIINIMVFQLDIIMNKIEENKQEMGDFEKIKDYIKKINELIHNNNLDKENFKIIEIFEEINDREIKNEELIKIALSIYKKNFLGIFKNNEIRVTIVNKNFYEFILKQIKEEGLCDRYKNKLEKIFLDD